MKKRIFFFCFFILGTAFSAPNFLYAQNISLNSEQKYEQKSKPILTSSESQAVYETLLELLQNPGPCWSPKTHLFYGTKIENLPDAAQVRALNPNPVGYGSGLDDCTLYGGTLLFGLVELYDLTHDEALRPLVHEAWLGMRNVGSAHHIRGFAARGVHPEDPSAVYVTSSRDQYTHYAESLWRFYHSPLCGETERAEIRELLSVLADSLMKEITPKNDFSIVRADGLHDPRGLHKMWNVYVHESARLPMIYAAAWNVTGEEKYREECLKYEDAALQDSRTLPERPRSEVNAWVPTYSFYQMQCSLELLASVEPDMQKKAEIHDIIQQTADFAAIRFPGLVVRKAGRREFAEILIAQTVLPDLKLREETRTFFKNILSVSGMKTTSAGQTVHLVRAYANACACGLAPIPNAVQMKKTAEAAETETSRSSEVAERFMWNEKPEAPAVDVNTVWFLTEPDAGKTQKTAITSEISETSDASEIKGSGIPKEWNSDRCVQEILTRASRPEHVFFFAKSCAAPLPASFETMKQAGITVHVLAPDMKEEMLIVTPRIDFFLTGDASAQALGKYEAWEKPILILTPQNHVLKIRNEKNAQVQNGVPSAPSSDFSSDSSSAFQPAFQPAEIAYLQTDAWETVCRPVSFLPGDLKARRTVNLKIPDLIPKK